MPASTLFQLELHGDVDQTALDALRNSLGLKKQGRLDDDFDQEFGYRYIGDDDERDADIALYRLPSGWRLVASHIEGTPPPKEVDAWKSKARAAASDAGLDSSEGDLR